MKVKYKQPVDILSCSNADFEFDIHLKVTNNDGTECVLYEPTCALKFVDNIFLKFLNIFNWFWIWSVGKNINLSGM